MSLTGGGGVISGGGDAYKRKLTHKWMNNNNNNVSCHRSWQANYVGSMVIHCFYDP